VIAQVVHSGLEFTEDLFYELVKLIGLEDYKAHEDIQTMLNTVRQDEVGGVH
jgi:hypothetical protein